MRSGPHHCSSLLCWSQLSTAPSCGLGAPESAFLEWAVARRAPRFRRRRAHRRHFARRNSSVSIWKPIDVGWSITMMTDRLGNLSSSAWQSRRLCLGRRVSWLAFEPRPAPARPPSIPPTPCRSRSNGMPVRGGTRSATAGGSAVKPPPLCMRASGVGSGSARAGFGWLRQSVRASPSAE